MVTCFIVWSASNFVKPLLGLTNTRARRKLEQASMLKRMNRLERKTVERIFKKGRRQRLETITVRSLQNSLDTPRIAIILPKRLKLSPVERNRLRRQLYSTIEEILPRLPKQDSALVLSQLLTPDAFGKEIQEWVEQSS